MKAAFPKWPAVLWAVLFLGGCAAEPPKLPRLFWPPPPEAPRLEFLGAYASRKDLPKTRTDLWLDEMLGPAPYDGLRTPGGLFTDAAGRICVVDTREGNVRVFDLEGKKVGYLFQKSLPPFDEPADAGLDASGNLYILDRGKRKVLVFSPEGKPLFSFGGPPDLESPGYLEIDSERRRIYVSDMASHRIVVYDPGGNQLFAFGGAGEEEGRFRQPQGLAVDREGNLFVADRGNGRIQVFDGSGNFLRLFGTSGGRDAPMVKPQDLDFDSKGNLHLVDGGTMALVSFSPEGELLLAAGARQPTNHLLGLSSPTAIHIDPNDRIIITDRFNHRISLWQCLYENYLAEHPVSDADLKRLSAFSNKLKRQFRERQESQRKTVIAEKKEPPPPRIVVRLRTLYGEPIDSAGSATQVRCPNCGIGVEVEDPAQAKKKEKPAPSPGLTEGTRPSETLSGGSS